MPPTLPARAEPGPPPYESLAIDFLTGMSLHLKKRRRTHPKWEYDVSEEVAGPFHIQLSLLDLDRPGGEFLLVEPIPAKEMASWLKTLRPWESDERDYMSLDPLGEDELEREGHFEVAREVALAMEQYAISAWNDEWSPGGEEPGQLVSQGFMGDYTRWRTIMRWPSYLSAKYKNKDHGPYFECVWKHNHGDNEGARRWDPTEPHFSVCLADNAPKHPTRPMFGEIMTILQLIYWRMRDTYWRPMIVPVTMISISGRDARVLHAYADPIRRQLHVRMSKIMDLTNGQDPRRPPEDWLRLLRWGWARPNMAAVRALEHEMLKPLAAQEPYLRQEEGNEHEDENKENDRPKEYQRSPPVEPRGAGDGAAGRREIPDRRRERR